MTNEQVTQQIEVTGPAGVARYLVSYTEIDQSWKPKILQWKSAR